MMRWLRLLVATLALVTPLFAQAPAPQRGTGLILGRVVDADSGAGLSNVIVTLGSAIPVASQISELAEVGSTPAATGRRSLTASDGRFLFRDLPKGRYALTTTSVGYVPGTYGQGRPAGPGQLIDLEDAQKLGGVSVRVWKYAAISGMVLDEAGEPAVGVSVACRPRVIAGGKPRFGSNTGLPTDDRGVYRIGSLVPGDYACGTVVNQSTVPMSVVDVYDAASRSGALNTSAPYRSIQDSAGRVTDPNGLTVGNLIFRPTGLGGRGFAPPPPAARMQTYAATYFPAAPTIGQASLISVKSGEERSGVDLHLQLAPAVRLAGQVTGPNGPGAFLGMTLVPASGSDMISEGTSEYARTISDANGAFTFLGIAPGSYIIKARLYPHPPSGPAGANIDAAPTLIDITTMPAGSGLLGRGATPPPPPLADPGLWVQMPVTIGDTDLTNLSVVLRPALRVSGRVEFVGTRQAPVADLVQRMAIRMQSAEGRTSAPTPAEGRAAADLTFRTAGYQAGRYIGSVVASTIPQGWTLKSIVSGGRDISVEPLELVDHDVSDVVVTFTDQATELTGAVTTSNGAPDGSAEVVIFPADSLVWQEIGVVARRWRTERVSKTGTFSVTGLPAGEYFVAAVPSNGAGDTRDPKFLTTLIRTATRVTLTGGSSARVMVKRQ